MKIWIRIRIRVISRKPVLRRFADTAPYPPKVSKTWLSPLSRRTRTDRRRTRSSISISMLRKTPATIKSSYKRIITDGGKKVVTKKQCGTERKRVKKESELFYILCELRFQKLLKNKGPITCERVKKREWRLISCYALKVLKLWVKWNN